MRILFITRSFNSLTQRLYADLAALGHELSLELDIADAVAMEAAELWQPDVVIASFLQRALPEALWRRWLCWVVHPGPVGDRGPSALDWAITLRRPLWGVTVLQATAEMDAGPVWASETFTMREATKSSLYRREVSAAASRAVSRALATLQPQLQRCGGALRSPPPQPTPMPNTGWRPLLKQADRRIDWQHDDTDEVLRKIRAADGVPGVADTLFGEAVHLFDATAEPHWAADTATAAAAPATPLARWQHALLVKTRDCAVWIGHVRRLQGANDFKLPTAVAFHSEMEALPEFAGQAPTCNPVSYEVDAERRVGVLRFAFYNGALSTAACTALLAQLQQVLREPPRVLVLGGGPEYWCNGIHLGVIEAAASPADESWANIQAIDDLTLALIEATGCWVVAALHGHAAAGGAFMALAADEVWAHEQVLLNPHYKNMGNLYGSEYWTYLLPARLRKAGSGKRPEDVMQHRLPLSSLQAQALGLVDQVWPADGFSTRVAEAAQQRAGDPALEGLLAAKQQRRADDEARRPLAAYRADELTRMHRNFYGFDPSYHVARSNFMRRVLPAWTPRHLARHR